MAANYASGEWLRHLFMVGRSKDCTALEEFLAKKYKGEAILCKNGRSALALALKAYFKPGDAILVNGFTCYAVYEAVKAAKLTPVWVDISREDLNFDLEALEKNATAKAKGIIVQNTLGNPVDIKAVEKIAPKVDILVVKRSIKGSFIKKDDEEYNIGIFKVDTVDTTGAGDAYNAGFLFGYINGYSLEESGIIGSYIAAQSTTKTGATEAIPHIQDIDISEIIQNLRK